ncbi:MAG: transporter substrate-binding domain-containing protein [Castellaniella sp.]|uniref:transporter substrate-binding domain-containing protein n=1 Tax=Castellaniella sp. TaxID=1955812 RepID=UPI003C749F4C
MFKRHTLRGILGGTVLAACTSLAVGLAPAASAETIDQVKQKGELTVGMLVDFPPYGIMNTDNQPDGYDADVAKILAKDLGVKVKIMPVTGPNRIPYLLTDKVDMLVASLAITPERAKQVQFSQPYSAAQIVVFGEKGQAISGPEGLSGKRIGVARASTQDIAVTKIAPKDADIRRFDDDASAMQALLSGQVDAIGCSTTVAAGIAQRAPDRFDNKFVLLQQEMAVAIRPGQPETLKAVNEVISRNIQNGTFSQSYQKWLGSPLPELKQ